MPRRRHILVVAWAWSTVSAASAIFDAVSFFFAPRLCRLQQPKKQRLEQQLSGASDEDHHRSVSRSGSHRVA